MTRHPRTARLIAAVVTLVLATACGSQASGPASSSAAAAPSTIPDRDALRVVATTTVFADIVRNVGGSRVDVQSIIPVGVGPEDYEPQPADARTLSDAQLIVSNGVGLDTFLDRLLEATSARAAKRIVLGEGIPTIDIEGQPNPHFWLDPSLVRTGYLPKIVGALSELAPRDRSTFEANAAAYGRTLETLDSELQVDAATIPQANRKLVTFHDAFPYLARHYGFELVGVVVANVGQEPTPTELAKLVAQIKATGTKAVFSESQFNPKLSRTLADEAGIKQVVTTLYNDALGPPPADTYVGMMRWDIERIIEALR